MLALFHLASCLRVVFPFLICSPTSSHVRFTPMDRCALLSHSFSLPSPSPSHSRSSFCRHTVLSSRVLAGLDVARRFGYHGGELLVSGVESQFVFHVTHLLPRLRGNRYRRVPLGRSGEASVRELQKSPPPLGAKTGVCEQFRTKRLLSIVN